MKEKVLMEHVPLDVLYIVCDFSEAVDVMRIRLTCKRNVVPRKYARERNRERAYCFLSPSTTIVTERVDESRYRSRIVVVHGRAGPAMPTTLTCYSRRGYSCKKVCEKMVNIVVPYVSGRFQYLEQ